jgi:hypothetical protein
MDKLTFQVGDLVMIADEYARPAHRGLTYLPGHKKLPVNLGLEPVTGGRRIRANSQVLVPATDAADATVAEVPFQPPLWPGQGVTVTGPG